jgi:hypothetical protein
MKKNGLHFKQYHFLISDPSHSRNVLQIVSIFFDGNSGLRIKCSLCFKMAAVSVKGCVIKSPNTKLNAEHILVG